MCVCVVLFSEYIDKLRKHMVAYMFCKCVFVCVVLPVPRRAVPLALAILHLSNPKADECSSDAPQDDKRRAIRRAIEASDVLVASVASRYFSHDFFQCHRRHRVRWGETLVENFRTVRTVRTFWMPCRCLLLHVQIVVARNGMAVLRSWPARCWWSTPLLSCPTMRTRRIPSRGMPWPYSLTSLDPSFCQICQLVCWICRYQLCATEPASKHVQSPKMSKDVVWFQTALLKGCGNGRHH